MPGPSLQASATPSFGPKPEAIAHFRKNPHLASLIDSPAHAYITPASGTLHRQEKRTHGPPTSSGSIVNAFFELTLHTPSTIPHVLALRLKEFPPTPAIIQTPLTTSQKPPTPTPTGPPHTNFLIHLATPGVSGHPGIAHGGILSALLDQVLGIAVEAQQIPVFSKPTFTSELEVEYLAPVPVPGDYVFRCWGLGRQGRAIWGYAEMVDGAGKGKRFCTGRGLLIEAKEERRRTEEQRVAKERRVSFRL